MENAKFLPQHVDEIDALVSIFPDRVAVLSSANEPEQCDQDSSSTKENATASSGAAYAVLKVSVPLNFSDGDRDCAIVEAWLDEELSSKTNKDDCEKAEETPTANLTCRPAFERTVSGRRLYCQFSVIELAPIELVIILLPGYPEFNAPDFVILSASLSNVQKSVVCRKLDEIASENAGLPIILSWLDWLQNDCLKFLEVTNIILSTQTMSDEVDCRIGDTELSILQRIEMMMRYDVLAEQRRFAASDHECPVCIDVFPGTQFYRIDSCRHYCCRGCLLFYVQQSMQDGKVQFLKCPEDKCDTVLPIPIIRGVLSDEEWRRWETLALSRALDTMGDLDWCPRCQMPVVREEDHQQSHLARCAYCYFAFCTQCKEAWHQGRKCTSLEEKLEALGNTDANNQKEKSEYEKRRALQRKLEILSAFKVKQTTKPCPSCRAPIEKDYGCNKVCCSNCHENMCYVCGKKIENYDHFNQGGSCPLTDESSYEQPVAVARPPPVIPDAVLQMEVMLEFNPELKRQVTLCPACRQRNLKLNRNNHMRCWACHSNFCYLCRSRIVGAMKTHFGVTANKCLQHSDD